MERHFHFVCYSPLAVSHSRGPTQINFFFSFILRLFFLCFFFFFSFLFQLIRSLSLETLFQRNILFLENISFRFLSAVCRLDRALFFCEGGWRWFGISVWKNAHLNALNTQFLDGTILFQRTCKICFSRKIINFKFTFFD